MRLPLTSGSRAKASRVFRLRFDECHKQRFDTKRAHSFKTLLMARESKRLRVAVNLSTASTVGRFWVITEV